MVKSVLQSGMDCCRSGGGGGDYGIEVENHLGRKCPFLGCLLLEICKKIYTENSTENWRASIKIDW